MRCNLRKVGIGDGMRCTWCKDITRPKDPKSEKKMCEYEEVLETYYRDV